MDDSYLATALAPLRQLITTDVVEICVNPDGTVWVENRGDKCMSKAKVMLSAEEVESSTMQIAADGEIRLSDDKPIGSVSVDFEEWMIRAQVIRSPAVRGGNSLSMRFFRPDTEVFEPAYIGDGPQSASEARKKLTDMVATLAPVDLIEALRVCVKEKLNIVVSGGTSSGKTTVARWLVAQVSDEERILTIEDVPDLLPKQPNKVMMVSDRKGDSRTPDMLLQASLRMRPDRIILSEVTGADAYTFLKAINTGHGGSMTTIHAETAEMAVERLAQTALEADGKMTYSDMISYVVRSIDVIVHVAKRGGERGVMEVFLPSNYLGPQEENSDD